MGRPAKKPAIKLIELKDNTAIVTQYANSPRVLTKADIHRLLDIESSLYLATVNNTHLKLQNEPIIDSKTKADSRSWNSIVRHVGQIYKLSEAQSTNSVLDGLLQVLNEFDWTIKKRSNTESLIHLKAMLTWNIEDKYKTEIARFINRFKVIEAKLYNRKRRIKLEY